MTTASIESTVKTRQKRTYIAKTLPTEGFVRKPTFISVLGISESTFNAKLKNGIIPPGKLISARTRVWNVKEVRGYIAKLEKESLSALGPGVPGQTKHA